jgi:hypothetical protein
MKQYLKKTFQVEYKAGIYDLPERLILSRQKAHADYANANAQEQKAFLESFTKSIPESDEKTAIVAYDEFSVSGKQTSCYGRAENNTRPKVKTNEKKQPGPMDS